MLQIEMCVLVSFDKLKISDIRQKKNILLPVAVHMSFHSHFIFMHGYIQFFHNNNVFNLRQS